MRLSAWDVAAMREVFEGGICRRKMCVIDLSAPVLIHPISMDSHSSLHRGARLLPSQAARDMVRQSQPSKVRAKGAKLTGPTPPNMEAESPLIRATPCQADSDDSRSGRSRRGSASPTGVALEEQAEFTGGAIPATLVCPSLRAPQRVRSTSKRAYHLFF